MPSAAAMSTSSAACLAVFADEVKQRCGDGSLAPGSHGGAGGKIDVQLQLPAGLLQFRPPDPLARIAGHGLDLVEHDTRGRNPIAIDAAGNGNVTASNRHRGHQRGLALKAAVLAKELRLRETMHANVRLAGPVEGIRVGNQIADGKGPGSGHRDSRR